ncbi:MAG: UDP-N-acetylmuramoylalanyl-D-glutamyl-2, 6-diaminopimelate--D-alanyl-D-alanine ligase, partial [Elusimicrobia bacterium]|nr:UDP-N-acetylmuramoylalanyl-D-glutamyl-2, 6-diaminopimelate--D-alanyl-D-alanine ligase [Elusimicrobiota bacterium]
KLLVLGDMKELGGESRRFHAELGGWLAKLPVDGVFLAGPEMKAAADALCGGKPGFPVRYALNPEEWLAQLKGELGPERAVFVKASRAMRFENVAQAL